MLATCLALLLAASPEAQAVPQADAAFDPNTVMAVPMDVSAKVEARVAALQGLSDERLVLPLVYLMHDPKQPVGIAAARALGGIKARTAEDALLRAIMDGNLKRPIREEAVRALASQGLESTPERLLELSGKSSKAPSYIGKLASKELKTRYPGRVPAEPSTAGQPLSGRPLFVIDGIVYGGYTLYAIGSLGQLTDVGPAIGLVGGAVLGGVAGGLLSGDTTPTQALTFGTATGLGLWAGLGVGYGILDIKPDDKLIHLAGLGGEAVGMLVGIAAYKALEPHFEVPAADRRWGEWVLAPGTAALGGVGLHLISTYGKSDSLEIAGVLSGTVLGGATGVLLGRKLTPAQGFYDTLGTGWGLALGALTARATMPLDTSDRAYEALALAGGTVGLGLGALSWTLLQPQIEVPSSERRHGEWLLAPGTAALGGVGLHVLSRYGPDDSFSASSVVSGIVLGGATGVLLGRTLTPAQAAHHTLATGWGFLLGALTARAAMPLKTSDRAYEALTLAGGTVGLGLGALTWDPSLDGASVFGMTFIGATGTAIGLGSVYIPEPRDDARPGYAVVAGVAGVSLIAGRLIAPHLQLSGGDRLLTSFGAVQGLLAGVATPGLFDGNPPDRHYSSGLLIGAGAGTLAALALSQVTEVEPKEVGLITLTDAYTSVAGLGAGFLAVNDSSSPSSNIGYLAGSALGIATAAAFADQMQLSGRDALMLPLASAWGLSQGLGLAIALDADDRRLGGATLLGLGLGGASTLALSSVVDVPPTATLATFSGGVWGAWVSLSAISIQADPKHTDAYWFLAATDAGLLATAGLLAAGVTPQQVGIADLGGLAGAVTGTLGAAMFTEDSSELIAANLIGAGVGLAGGAIVAALVGGGNDSEPTAIAPDAPEAGATWLPGIEFKGLTTQPVIGRDGRPDGFALSLMMQND